MTRSLLFTVAPLAGGGRVGSPVRFRCRGDANGSVLRLSRLAADARESGRPLIALDCESPANGLALLKSPETKVRRFTPSVYYWGDLSEAVLAGALMQNTLAAKEGVALSPRTRPLDANFICWRVPGGGVAARAIKEVKP